MERYINIGYSRSLDYFSVCHNVLTASENVNSNAFLVIFKAKLGNFKIIIKLVSQKLDFL